VHIAAPNTPRRVQDGRQHAAFAARLEGYPRIRFMGSKYRLAARLAELFENLPPGPALGAFSGSGVVAYTLEATGRSVLANDELTFATTLAEATVANDEATLSATEIEEICSGSLDGRDFIATTFDGLYFPRILRQLNDFGQKAAAA
jgi:adenine-specific DNA-methyltransferase